MNQTAAPALEESIRAWAAEKGVTAAQAEIVAGSRELLATLQGEALPAASRLPVQLIHHDFRAANLIWDGEKIAAPLDFEELRWGYRVEDLAWAAVHLGTRFRNWGPVPEEVHALFLGTYRAEMALTADEDAWLPILRRWHGLDLARK
jgi:homoserine kinase type II